MATKLVDIPVDTKLVVYMHIYIYKYTKYISAHSNLHDSMIEFPY